MLAGQTTLHRTANYRRFFTQTSGEHHRVEERWGRGRFPPEFAASRLHLGGVWGGHFGAQPSVIAAVTTAQTKHTHTRPKWCRWEKCPQELCRDFSKLSGQRAAEPWNGDWCWLKQCFARLSSFPEAGKRKKLKPNSWKSLISQEASTFIFMLHGADDMEAEKPGQIYFIPLMLT